MAVNILLYEDNELLRESLKLLIESDSNSKVLALMPNAETVETDLTTFAPDVILMDIDMPGINGVEAVKRIRKINQAVPVIMITVFEDNENIFNALCAGASGYILKKTIDLELNSAISMVMSGGAPMTGLVAKKVLTMLPQKAIEEKTPVHLTEKETSILQFLVNGYSYKMIAGEINLSIDTVRFHIKKIYDKLHVHSATEAVSKAIRERLI
ncbi:MAG: response regulator [Bacteroidota bacterium]